MIRMQTKEADLRLDTGRRCFFAALERTKGEVLPLVAGKCRRIVLLLAIELNYQLDDPKVMMPATESNSKTFTGSGISN